jgi:hypothetical protein
MKQRTKERKLGSREINKRKKERTKERKKKRSKGRKKTKTEGEHDYFFQRERNRTSGFERGRVVAQLWQWRTCRSCGSWLSSSTALAMVGFERLSV